jgi:hypothetical protein
MIVRFCVPAGLSAILAAGVVCAPVAHAGDWALNGTYRATSNGAWAKTNDVYRNEATVQSTWTISMHCTNVLTCSGRVTSDAGWSADVTTTNTEYNVLRELPGWEPCADGSTVSGHQRYRFFPVDDTGYLLPGSRLLGGFDTTMGASGGCNLNDKLEISMPFRLEKVA